MSLLEQVLAGNRGSAEPVHRNVLASGEMTGATRVRVLSAEHMFVIGEGEKAEASPLYESGVAYVENPNPLVALARSFNVPEGYGQYGVSSDERPAETGDPDSFSLKIIDPE